MAIILRQFRHDGDKTLSAVSALTGAVRKLGGNLIWFGIVTVIGVEIGLLTLPVGLTVYVVKATISDRNTTLGDIFIGTFPLSS